MLSIKHHWERTARQVMGGGGRAGAYTMLLCVASGAGGAGLIGPRPAWLTGQRLDGLRSTRVSVLSTERCRHGIISSVHWLWHISGIVQRGVSKALPASQPTESALARLASSIISLPPGQYTLLPQKSTLTAAISSLCHPLQRVTGDRSGPTVNSSNSRALVASTI